MNKKELQAKIAQEAAKENPDYSIIEQLSGQLVDLDPSRVRFSVDAGHIQRLGVELVAKQDTALSELIKNSYDADATQVSLTFSGRGSDDSTLTITDDGVGMTPAVIRSAWMRIATESKVEQRQSTKFHRTYAGRKGIGRFAVQRLGKHLVLETGTKGSNQGSRVKFDWDDEFTPGRSLDSVFSAIESYEKDADEHGTTLKIIHLRDDWKDSAIQKVWKSVLLLQPPFPVVKVSRKAKTETADPGFRVTIDGSALSDVPEMSIEKTFLANALATITGTINKEGVAVVRVSSDVLDLDEQHTVSKKYLTTGELTLSTRYFIYDPEFLGGISQRAAATMGRNFGGIRIYRNGFRVLPYGETTDDWLRLDYDTARRNILVAASNRNMFGHVELNDDCNPLFEETASREGLIENVAFEELQEFAHDAVEWGAKQVAAVRNRKQTAHQPDFVSELRKPSAVLNELKQKLQPREGDDDGGDEVDDVDLDGLVLEVQKYEEKVEADQRASIEYEQMLRLLASLGLSVSVFGHEIIGAQDAMKSRLQLLKRAISKMEESPSKTSLASQFVELTTNSARIFDVGGYVSGLVSNTESRELETLSLKGAIDRFKKQFKDYLAAQKVIVSGDVLPIGLRTLPMHKSEIDSVLLNLLTNSIKSLRASKVDNRRIAINARRDGRLAVVSFEDNGLGIPRDKWARVFDAFYTTTFSSDGDSLSGPGTGLGLKIVSDIAANYGGYAQIAEASGGFSCKVEFAIPAI